MNLTKPLPNATDDALMGAVRSALYAIPPAWPLSSSVAVNPFLGQADDDLASAGERLSRALGCAVTLPRDFYAGKIASGEISDEDLAGALAAQLQAQRPDEVEVIKQAARRPAQTPQALPDLATLAAKTSGKDWPRLVEETIGLWAAGFLDEGQALWAAPKSPGAYAAWREYAMHDLTPEIAGLTGFARHVSEAPLTAQEAIARSATRLGLAPGAAEAYFHRLLAGLGGWAQVARYRLWQAELDGKADDTLLDLLAIRLVWEEALFCAHEKAIGDLWQKTQEAYGRAIEATAEQILDVILQEALERSAQRRLAKILKNTAPSQGQGRPALQAAFCIDVRSEVFRRALESLDPSIQTLGFAGFFGLGVQHRAFASDLAEKRLPVLLQPSLFTCEKIAKLDEGKKRARARAARAWGRFRSAAVSSFAFVEAMGPVYLGKLAKDALGLAQKKTEAAKPSFVSDVSLDERVKAAAAILGAMSMKDSFAPLVLLIGHGASTANNPHASALHCGACGGYEGDVNARLLAALLNDGEVRQGLKAAGFALPDDTRFIAALHDTTSDEVRLFDDDNEKQADDALLGKVRGWLASAGRIARSERALRLPGAKGGASLPRRTRDWSEVRPEWALAGCQAFIAAPRIATLGKNLGSRVFLHDYDWRLDKGFSVLELIMTAPVVVASWISLQYYGSVVAPEAFGAGNKLLHNVVGGIGVLEGNGATLRAGLPWQSVHSGEGLVHEPLRLSVCIGAPLAAMEDILQRYPSVKRLFDNKWLHLFQLDDEGHMLQRYIAPGNWEALRPAPATAG